MTMHGKPCKKYYRDFGSLYYTADVFLKKELFIKKKKINTGKEKAKKVVMKGNLRLKK